MIDYIAEHVSVKVEVLNNLQKNDGYVNVSVTMSNDGDMDITSESTRKMYFNRYSYGWASQFLLVAYMFVCFLKKSTALFEYNYDL